MIVFKKICKRTKGQAAFTLIELLVVIAIIGLLASVIFVALGNARVKARDAKRVADTHQIVVALNLYYDQNGCLPIPGASTCPGKGSYTQSDNSSWDYSSQPVGAPVFMTFLQNAGFMATVPLDPINDEALSLGSPGYAYRYHCLASGPFLDYKRESDNQVIHVLGTGIVGDSSYVCK